MMDKVQIYSNRVICCAQEETTDTYTAKFVICDFSVNENRRQLNQDTIKNWMGTLVNKPLVGKIVTTSKGSDFTGHNMKIVWKKDENGNVYKDAEFDTDAFGTFTNVAIEKIDDVDCVVATCEIWKRFTKACALILKRIENGTLNSSWEITILDSHNELREGKIIKVIDDGIFTAHCLLGEKVTPAYACSRMLEVAELDQDNEESLDDEITNAIGQDISVLNQNNEMEVKGMNKKEIKDAAVESTESNVSNTVEMSEKSKPTEKTDEEKKDKDPPAPVEDDDGKGNDTHNDEDEEKKDDKDKASTNETASLTDADIFQKIYKLLRDRGVMGYIDCIFPEEHEVWVKRDGNRTEYDVYHYGVEDDNVVLGDPQPAKMTMTLKEASEKVSQLADAVAKAASDLKTKDDEIAELVIYKEKFEEVEQKRIAAEIAEKQDALRKSAVSSGFITEAEVSEGGELAELIAKNDDKAIKCVIADRYMQSVMEKAEKEKGKKPAKEVSEKVETVKANLVDKANVKLDMKSLMNDYLNRK